MPPIKNVRSLISISHMIKTDRGHIAFGVDLDSGEDVFIPPPIVAREDINEDDIGAIFYGFTKEVEGKSALRLAAFLEWQDDEPVTGTAPDLRKAAAANQVLVKEVSVLQKQIEMLEMQKKEVQNAYQLARAKYKKYAHLLLDVGNQITVAQKTIAGAQVDQ